MIDMTITAMRRSPPLPPTASATSVALGNLTNLTSEVPMASDEMTPGEVADELGVSAATVRRWEVRGVLLPSRRFPGSRHRRYRREDVEALKAEMKGGAKSD